MMLRIVFIVLIFLSFKSRAQEYSKVDEIVKNYPVSFVSIETLKNRIQTDFILQEEQVRAIYGWLTMNIEYDSGGNTLNSFDISDHRIFSFNDYDKAFILKRQRLKKIAKTLTSKRATCKGYTNLFKELCNQLGIEAVVISGFSKVNLDYIDTNNHYKNHAWNAVKINKTWRLLDVTWGASTLGTYFEKNYEYYFFTNPTELILTHFPINPSWQLQENNISKEQFFNTPLFYTNYFIDKFKIAHFQHGAVKADNNKLKIYFDQIPKDKKISYRLANDINAKPIRFIKNRNGHYEGSIKYGKVAPSKLTIYANNLPVLGFRIKQKLKN